MGRKIKIPAGHAVLVHHDGGASCSWNGQTFEADSEGRIVVPPEAVSDLASHGWVMEMGDAEPEAVAEPAPAGEADAAAPAEPEAAADRKA